MIPKALNSLNIAAHKPSSIRNMIQTKINYTRGKEIFNKLDLDEVS